MQKSIQISIRPEVAAQPSLLRRTIADEIGLSPAQTLEYRVRRRSIDARQRHILVNLRIDLYIDEPMPAQEFEPVVYPDVSSAPQVIVVGAGPGGLYAALRLVELGLRPLVLERGKDVHERRKDIARISREHIVDGESNYSFGEGGAGAYSDGKLYTRSKKRGNIEKILRVFCQFGADTRILTDAHPHIGTDKLPGIIERMRNQIIQSGGNVLFGRRVTQLLTENGRVCGVVTANGESFDGPLILATGHSARDVYSYLADSGILVESKGLAIGVRLEHPSALIDAIQYHNPKGRGPYLPAAEYNYVTQVNGRGVYSFCMCPGGFVVPAASGPEQVVVNGMSPSNRGSAWSNSGMVVETRPEDFATIQRQLVTEHSVKDVSPQDPLCMMHLQAAIEQATWIQGGKRQTAPAQRMTDFVSGRLSRDLPQTSYSPGVIASPLHFWLPKFLTSRLQEGFKSFGHRSRGFLSQEAVVIATETRTSSPVRIVRDGETLQSPSLPGLFPCGEGAGYAGGIVSSAVDGERCAEAVCRYLDAN